MLSQTTLVKQEDGVGKNYPSSGSKKAGEKCVFPFYDWDICSKVDTDFSRLFSALAEGATGECQRFSTFGLLFICHISSPCELGRKEKSIFLTYSEVGVVLQTPPCWILPSQPLSMYISISALWTYNLSVWVILHKYDPRSYCYLHIPTSHFSVIQISSLLFSNILN